MCCSSETILLFVPLGVQLCIYCLLVWVVTGIKAKTAKMIIDLLVSELHNFTSCEPWGFWCLKIMFITRLFPCAETPNFLFGSSIQCALILKKPKDATWWLESFVPNRKTPPEPSHSWLVFKEAGHWFYCTHPSLLLRWEAGISGSNAKSA